MDDSVSTHGGNYPGAGFDGLGSFDLGVGRSLRPHGLHLGASPQRRHHRPVRATGEL
jgi:hypothetical protein